MLAAGLRRFVAFVLGSLLALAMGEWWARSGSPEVQAYHVWWPNLERRFQPDPALLPGVAGAGVFRANQLGLRGRELLPGDAPRLLTVGGSTTECLFLDQEDSWPALLEASLAKALPGQRPWVGNAGKSGLNTRDHRVMLPPLLETVPGVDHVLVLAGVNDLMLRLSQDDSWDPNYREDPDHVGPLLRRNFQLLPLDQESRLGWQGHSALWRLAGRARERWFPSPQALDDSGQSIQRWRDLRRQASGWRDQLPDLTLALEEYADNLRALVRIADEHGARVWFLDQPYLYREDLEPQVAARLLFGGVGDHFRSPGCEYYTPAALLRGLEAYNQVLREVAAEEGVTCIELARDLSGRADLFYDDVHYGIAGAREVAQRVHAALTADPAFQAIAVAPEVRDD